MEQIRSRKNQYILHLRALARDKDVRRDAGEYVCDGEKLLREALQFGAEVTSVLWREAAAFSLPDGIAQYAADAGLVEYASPLMHSPGPVFTVRIPAMRLPEPLRRVIVLEGVQDPGNVGTVIPRPTPSAWTPWCSPARAPISIAPRPCALRWARSSASRC